MLQLRKTLSHGRIGEACVTAKCWMNGIPAHNTNGLRANFAGSDILIDTADPRRKLLVQVKTGYAAFHREEVYLTQAKGMVDLVEPKFKSDFVVFVNIEERAGTAHQHDGSLSFADLVFYVVPADAANEIFRSEVQKQYDTPKRGGGRRSLTNIAVFSTQTAMAPYRESWSLLKA